MKQDQRQSPSRVVIYGAGSAGELVVEGLSRLKEPSLIAVAFVDDDPSRAGGTLHGLPIECASGSIRAIVEKYKADRVLIAIPSAPGRRIREIHKKLFDEGVLAWIVPGVYSIVSSNEPITTFREIKPEDFLRRHPRVLDKGRIRPFLRGQRVLVTGAAGTIGMELAGQLAAFDLEALGCADQSEYGIYRLKEIFSAEGTTAPTRHFFLADLSRESDVQAIFDEFRPTVVFHAAAYKHVRLLESAPRAAILNNIGSTYHLVQFALQRDVRAFVHISTDKAIQPVSVMGATKRAGEIVVQAAQVVDPARKFLSVRFGNVLGSSGSVFPKFVEQIERGGPVTVSDPGARRYFMLTSEAVELVLWSAAVGSGGKIYLLDLGEPVYITELVNDLMRFMGRRPGRDIEIVYTGLEPGEKLLEDFSDVSAKQIDEHLLEVESDLPSPDTVESTVAVLMNSAVEGDMMSALLALQDLVPEYNPDFVQEKR